MTASRSEQLQAALIGLALALFVVAGLDWFVTELPDGESAPASRSYDRRPTPNGPAAWRATAAARDVLAVPGYKVGYWGDPAGKYSVAVARRVRGIVVHFPGVGARGGRPNVAYALIGALHKGRPGYTVLIDRWGRIFQAAPLSKRTPHVKPPGHVKRRPSGPAWGSNSTTIGIALIGACDPSQTNPQATTPWDCRQEFVTPEQRDAAVAVVKALQRRFSLPCKAIWGHGELQTDRQAFEGQTITTLIRTGCDGQDDSS